MGVVHACAGCTADWQRCTDNPTCCGGMKCYQQDSYWAQCRPEGDVPQGWTLMSGSSPAQTSSPIVEATPEEQPQNSGSGSGVCQADRNHHACMRTTVMPTKCGRIRAIQKADLHYIYIESSSCSSCSSGGLSLSLPYQL